jgi:hypothetical protein
MQPWVASPLLSSPLLHGISDRVSGASPAFSWHSSLAPSTAGPKSVSGRSFGTRSKSGMTYDDGNESVYHSEAGSSDHRSTTDPSCSSSQPLLTPSSRNAPSEISESRSIASRVTTLRPGLGAHRPTNHPSAQINNTVQWSTDLTEVTEALEASLNDPKSSGSFYIRLLVKAVSGLSCEEDAERMIFEVPPPPPLSPTLSLPLSLSAVSPHLIRVLQSNSEDLSIG